MMVRAAGALSSTPTTLATLVPWCPVLLGPPRDPVYVTIGPRTAVRFTRAPQRAASVWRTSGALLCGPHRIALATFGHSGGPAILLFKRLQVYE